MLVTSIAVIPSISYEAVAENQTVDVNITRGASTKTTDAYDPNPVEIDVGDSVVWTNNDPGQLHSATSGSDATYSGVFGDPAAAGSILRTGQNQSFTFTEAGEFQYYCFLHPNMVGIVIVGEAEASVTVEADQPSYEIGDDVTASGNVAPVQPELPLIISVIREDGTLIRIDQVTVDPTGPFSYSFQLGGLLFEEDLSYSVIVDYDGASAETSFFISSSTVNGGTCQTFTPTIIGTEEADVIEGTEGDDVIFGLGGDDVIDGLSGNDKICGGPGDDTISGGDGDDRVSGGRGNDLLFGDAGGDLMLGGTGYDDMFGSDGNDSLLGGKGNDFLDGGEGDDNLDGEDGEDREVNGPLDDLPRGGSDIEVELDDIDYGQGDNVEISGNIDGVHEGDDVDITIREADGGSDNADTTISNDNGDFDSEYQISDNADDGIYQVEVEFGTEDPVFTYFLVDEDDDAIDVVTDKDVYEPGDEVVIEGEVQDVALGVDEVEITVIDPSGDEILSSQDAQLDIAEFGFEFDLNDDLLGRYAIIVEYDGEDGGFFIFEVEENGGGGSSDFVSAELSKTSFEQGEKVEVSGEVDEDDVEVGVEVFVTVDDPDGNEIFDDSAQPEPDGYFDFNFELEDDGPAGEYKVTLSYEGYDDRVLVFEVDVADGS